MADQELNPLQQAKQKLAENMTMKNVLASLRGVIAKNAPDTLPRFDNYKQSLRDRGIQVD